MTATTAPRSSEKYNQSPLRSTKSENLPVLYFYRVLGSINLSHDFEWFSPIVSYPLYTSIYMYHLTSW